MVHVAFSAVFFALNAPLLGWANVGSVAMSGVIHRLLRRRRNAQAVLLMWADVDHFKSVNDHHGHDVGDRVLAKVAQAMTGATRERDTRGALGR